MAVLRCIEAFAFSDHKTNVERVVRPGDLVDAKDPLVKGREMWFESVDATVDRVSDRTVEQATAAPGEKRTARRAKSVDQTNPKGDSEA
jgi:chloramphenicol 3-O-phosphotransferase